MSHVTCHATCCVLRGIFLYSPSLVKVKTQYITVIEPLCGVTVRLLLHGNKLRVYEILAKHAKHLSHAPLQYVIMKALRPILAVRMTLTDEFKAF